MEANQVQSQAQFQVYPRNLHDETPQEKEVHFPIVIIQVIIINQATTALTINLSKSCISLKQCGPHGTPSDNIMSFPVICGFPEGI